MSMNVFVKKNDKIKVEVFAWYGDDGNIDSTQDKSQVPDAVSDVETFAFYFRKPNYQDSNIVMNAADLKANESGDTDMNLTKFQDTVLRNLLVDWDLKDSGGKKVPLKITSVNSLDPAIARSAVAGCLERVTFF